MDSRTDKQNYYLDIADSVLELPASVKLIEESAFYGDQALGTVVLPDGSSTTVDYAGEPVNVSF